MKFEAEVQVIEIFQPDQGSAQRSAVSSPRKVSVEASSAAEAERLILQGHPPILPNQELVVSSIRRV